MCDRSTQTLGYLIRLTRHPDDYSPFEKGGSPDPARTNGGVGASLRTLID